MEPDFYWKIGKIGWFHLYSNPYQNRAWLTKSGYSMKIISSAISWRKYKQQ